VRSSVKAAGRLSGHEQAPHGECPRHVGNTEPGCDLGGIRSDVLRRHEADRIAGDQASLTTVAPGHRHGRWASGHFPVVAMEIVNTGPGRACVAVAVAVAAGDNA
jgi:hypothetical protein